MSLKSTLQVVCQSKIVLKSKENLLILMGTNKIVPDLLTLFHFDKPIEHILGQSMKKKEKYEKTITQPIENQKFLDLMKKFLSLKLRYYEFSLFFLGYCPIPPYFGASKRKRVC